MYERGGIRTPDLLVRSQMLYPLSHSPNPFLTITYLFAIVQDHSVSNNSELTHLTANGEAQMVDVADKAITKRTAVAGGCVRMSAATLDAILAGNAPKGDALGTARIAGIMAAKQTANLVPLCHPLPLSKVAVELTPDRELPGFQIRATVTIKAETGVEMEALTAVSIAALTLYDMAKALEKSMTIENIHLISKTGGKSDFTRD
jgi:cyclic pyranopterin monophosphate synthase